MNAQTGIEVVERPFRGHFCAANDCRFFRTTDVGDKWRVSTIGDYHQGGIGRRQEIGYKRFFETMVFPLSNKRCEGCGGPCDGAQLVADWSEMEADAYSNAAEAEAGHAVIVAKYAALAMTARVDA